MDSIPKKTNHLVEFIIFLVMVICAILIIIDIYTNVASELQRSIVASLYI